MKSSKKRERLRNLRWLRTVLYILLPVTIAALLIVPVLQKSAVSAGLSAAQSAQTTDWQPSATPTPTAAPTLTPAPTAAAAQTGEPTPVQTREPTPVPTQSIEAVQDQSDDIDWYDGYADPRTINAEAVASPEDLTVLVNKYWSIPEDYTPDLVLADSSKNQYIRVEAEDSWDAMRAACETDTGYVLYLCSGYRTFETQAALFSKSIQNKGIGYACSKNAMEGRSEHNLGLALDISTTDKGVISSGFADTAAGAWVVEHCHEYGFILRYPKDKTEITGYVFEPWHYRYVGNDLAGTLFASGQTLEEYYGQVPAEPAES